MNGNIDFDSYADSYDRALAEGLAVSGESREYFAGGRVEWLAGQLRRLKLVPSVVMDFGCGTGSTSPLLLEHLHAGQVLGLDTSKRSLEAARRDFGAERIQFSLVDEYEPTGHVDVIYCNGVFHHIPLQERGPTLQKLFRALRSGGLFSLWENNPWNPGTQYVMSRVPFDRDAIKLSAPQARMLVRSEGFRVLQTDFVFFFPRLLKFLRPAEKFISGLPLGAQYQILCQKPE
jgi:SAM-dependent methyltransferase